MLGEKDSRVFSFGEECQKDGVLECCIFSEGAVVLTNKFALWAVSDLQDPRPQKLASPKMNHAPHTMGIIEPKHTLSGSVEVCTCCNEPAAWPTEACICMSMYAAHLCSIPLNR